MRRNLIVLCVLTLIGGVPFDLSAATLNGFDLRGAEVPAGRISQGGPPRDGIPALDQPRFVPASQVQGLKDEASVLGLDRNGVRKAYPIAIMNWHELVNDRFESEPVLISYCPLCGSGMAFRATIAGQARRFAVSGLLYNSDVLFYDRESESLWSQIDRRAISGPMQGERLEQIPLTLTTWAQWRAAHPDTQVLANDQGFQRNYRDDPYAGYERSRKLFFKVAARAPREYHTKERVLGIRRGQDTLALPFVELRRHGQRAFPVTVGGERLTVRWDAASSTARLIDAAGEPAVHTIAFWFAWFAFHPDTRVFRAETRAPAQP